MKLAGAGVDLPPHPLLSRDEQEAALLYAAATAGVQLAFLAAIRIAENGGPGKELGVLDPSADTYEAQAAWCARSVRNNLFRFVTAHNGAWPMAGDRYSPAFIDAMAARWAPRGAANDPTDLNAHWADNVRRIYEATDVTP